MMAKIQPDIKICGLKTREAVEAAVSLGASHVGFIFFEKSPRHIEPDLAAAIAEPARGRAKIVAVTVDADHDDLDDIVYLLKPDMLQLHGHESPEQMLTLKALYGLPLIKAFSLRTPADLDRIDPYIGVADRLLFDAKPPAGSDLPGGNGVTFDWRLLRDLDGSIDYFLSGGLTRDNVGQAMAETGARGLDVSSGVERAPGVKDIDRMEQFFAAVRLASAERPISRSAM